jgi:hypothetical protein
LRAICCIRSRRRIAAPDRFALGLGRDEETGGSHPPLAEGNQFDGQRRVDCQPQAFNRTSSTRTSCQHSATFAGRPKMIMAMITFVITFGARTIIEPV